MSTATDILKALRVASLRPVEVAGLKLHVRGLTGAERVLARQRALDGNPMADSEVAALCLCDEQANPLFTAEEAQELANVDGASVEKIARAVVEASGLSPDAQGEAVKN